LKSIHGFESVTEEKRRQLFAKYSLLFNQKKNNDLNFQNILHREILEDYFLVPPTRKSSDWENKLLDFWE